MTRVRTAPHRPKGPAPRAAGAIGARAARRHARRPLPRAFDRHAHRPRG